MAAISAYFLWTLVLLSCASGDETNPVKSTSVLERVVRKIENEPKYVSTPRYALLILGTNAEAKVWIVEDGDLLYIDKNANGDLADDGPPISQTNVRQFQSTNETNRDCEYILNEITPATGSKHTDFCLRRWKYGGQVVEYGLSLTLDGKTPMYAGWFGTFWASSPKSVPMVHFGGPLKPTPLGLKEIVLGSAPNRLGIGFVNRGSGEGTTSYLSIDALPKRVIPEVGIEWPVAKGAPPLRTIEHLTERCCYWQFYEQNFTVPQGVVEGTAILTISLPDGVLPFALATKQMKVPIRAKANSAPGK